jgi:hypothetical protein
MTKVKKSTFWEMILAGFFFYGSIDLVMTSEKNINCVPELLILVEIDPRMGLTPETRAGDGQIGAMYTGEFECRSRPILKIPIWFLSHFYSP